MAKFGRILFNEDDIFKKRRSGEASQFRVDVYNSRPDWASAQNQELNHPCPHKKRTFTREHY
jgi:hypothetical protein